MLSKKKKTWVLAADSAKARIFEWESENKHLREIIYINEIDARKPERDLRADRPGHGQGFNSKIQYTVDEHTSYKKQASQEFLKKLTKLLCEKENISEYDEIDIIAPEDVYHSIQKNMSAIGQGKITSHIAKNLTNMPILDIQKYYINQLT